MRKIQISEIAQILNKKNNIEILTHRSPDGDTVGSAFALCYALRKLGKNASVIIDGELPVLFSYLVEEYNTLEFDASYVVSVDVAAPSMLGGNQEKYENEINMCIDHHEVNTIIAEVGFIDPKAAATAEIIYDIISELNVEIDRCIANCIYAGIVTDTGCFKFGNTTEKTHLVASKLMNIASWQKINKIHFETKSLKRVELEKRVFSTLETFFNDQLAIIVAYHKDQKELNVESTDLDGLASFPREIEGVRMGVTIKEKGPKDYRISVRTNDGVNAAEFCKCFGGGGHQAAAGCSIQDDLEGVKKQIKETAEKFL